MNYCVEFMAESMVDLQIKVNAFLKNGRSVKIEHTALTYNARIDQYALLIIYSMEPLRID